MFAMEFVTKIHNSAATIYCPNEKCKMRLWLTNVRYMHQHCPSCGEPIRKAYILSDNSCVDRMLYYDSGKLT